MFSLLGPLFVLPGISESPLLQFWSKLKEHGIFLIGIILGLVIIYTARYFASPYRNLPPGPRGYPIIRNLLELRSMQWLKFTEWRKKYGQSAFSNSSWSISNADPTRRTHLSQCRRPADYRPQFSKSCRRFTRSTCGHIFRSAAFHRRMRHHDWGSRLRIFPLR
jgi:hypothetical protein